LADLRQPDHLSVHPGGVVITPGPLTDVVPVQMAPKGFLITQFDHGDVEALGLPKIDLLGIRALTVLADAADLVRTHYDPAFRVDAIPLADAATGEMLARGEPSASSSANRAARSARCASFRRAPCKTWPSPTPFSSRDRRWAAWRSTSSAAIVASNPLRTCTRRWSRSCAAPKVC
jgi:hypothetical protein